MRKKLLITIAVGVVIILVWYRTGIHEGITLCLVGDARTHLQGIVPAKLEHAYLDAEKIHIGIGSAALGSWSSLGDTVIIHGRAWLKTTHRASPNYYRLVSNRYFQSNHLAFLAPETLPTGSIKLPPGQMIKTLLTRLARKYRDGVFVNGYVRFTELNTIAIAKPAITSQAIMKQPAYYYTQPMAKKRDVWAYVIGITARRDPMFWWQDREDLSRVLPHIPHAKKWYLSLTRVLLLKQAPTDRALPPRPGNIDDVGQLVENSVIGSGQLWVFPIRQIKECHSAFVR